MIISCLGNTPFDTLVVGLFDVHRASTQATLRGLGLYVSRGTSFHSCNQAFRHVDNLFLTTCSAAMFAMYLLSDPKRATHSLPVFQAPVQCGVLARTHWGALRCPGKMASGTKAPTLVCCTAAEPVLTRATKQKTKEKTKRKKKPKKTIKKKKKKNSKTF